MTTRRGISIASVTAALATVAGWGLRANAEGVPTTQPLFYAGTLEASGELASGKYAITFAIHDAATDGDELCAAEALDVPVENGAFRIDVSDCAAALQSEPDAWVTVSFTGEDDVQHAMPGRTKVGAVPYALEAAHAVAASFCDDAETLGGLAATDFAPVDHTHPVQNAATLCNDGEYLDGDGTCKPVPVDTDTDTNAATLCNDGEYLDGDGTCKAVPVDTNTTYSHGDGLNLSGTVFSTNNAVVARKDAGAGNQAFDTNVLYLDYGNNRVGIGSTTPTQALDVVGTTRSTNFAYATAKTGSVIAVPASFSYDQHGTSTLTRDQFAFRFTSAPTTVTISAPIVVPTGATITTFGCLVDDRNATNDLVASAELKRYSRASTAVPTVATLSLNTTGNEPLATRSIAVSTTPVLSTNMFAIRVSLSATGTGAGVTFYSCWVDYSTTEVAP